MYQTTNALTQILKLTKRIRALQGGTAAGKTIGILLDLIDLAQKDTAPTITSIVSESLPHLKKGAMRDFLDILKNHKYYKDSRWNRTDCIYTFETGSIMEFFGADQADKVRGPRRDRLFINEANNIPFETFEQLEVRTRESIFLDWNPTYEFWFYQEVLGKRNDIDYIILTYKDNEALDKSIVESIETRMSRKGWWKVYGEGQLGEVEGKIYTDWQIINEIPHEAKLERRGMDFGYSNDPTAIVDIYRHNNGFILDEVCYQKGLSNKQISDVIKNQEHSQILVIADSAEPKSIDEIKMFGINIFPSVKGGGSVNQGIQFVKDQRISVTKRSVNIIKEYRNYLWKTDKNGKVINEPEEGFNHCMDAIRYGLDSYKPRRDIKPKKPKPILEGIKLRMTSY